MSNAVRRAQSAVRGLGIEVIKNAEKPLGVELIRLCRSQREGDLDLYHTPFGNYYVPVEAPDDIIARHMRTGRIFEPEVVEIAKRFIRPGTAVLDVGANFGQMALEFAKAGGTVYAIEAQKRVYDILLKNVEVNRPDNVVPVFKAAHSETGLTLNFPHPDFVRFDAYGSYNLPLDATEGDPVETVRLDDLPIELPVSFMKVDVQGCDLFAMQGATGLIAKHRMPILFEFEQRFQQEYGTTFQDYVEFAASINYRFAETVLDINYLIVPNG